MDFLRILVGCFEVGWGQVLEFSFLITLNLWGFPGFHADGEPADSDRGVLVGFDCVEDQLKDEVVVCSLLTC